MVHLLQHAGHNAIIPNTPEGYVFFKENAPLKDIFYHDCSEGDVKRAAAMLVPEPMAPSATPVNTTEANFGKVSMVYIECLQDKAIPAYLQKKMYTAVPKGYLDEYQPLAILLCT